MEIPFLDLSQPPRRVISLVPSITESLFDLGLGDRLIGVTEYCIRPDQAKLLPRVGGVLSPALDKIEQMQPDLIIANREENSRSIIEQFLSAGMRVWVTFPTNVVETLEMLWAIAGIFQNDFARKKVQLIQLAADWQFSTMDNLQKFRYFCPIWHETISNGEEWWMTFNRDTYPHDLLRMFGGMNCFADRERRYPLGADVFSEQPEQPGERDIRYPRLGLEEIRQADPDVVIFPDDPYSFSSAEAEDLLHKLGKHNTGRDRKYRFVGDNLLTWYGTRLAYALVELPAIFSDL